MPVLHAAKLANRNALAGGLQFLVAHILAFTRFAALCGGLVRGGHGAVLGDVFLGFFVAF
jgi:hypothetical protein